jgi:hypothetical protein
MHEARAGSIIDPKEPAVFLDLCGILLGISLLIVGPDLTARLEQLGPGKDDDLVIEVVRLHDLGEDELGGFLKGDRLTIIIRFGESTVKSGKCNEQSTSG